VEESPQKGFFQVLSIFGYIFAIVAAIAFLSGHDPTYILSGMTALSAVLMLIFKDSILGLTAGVTLAGNGMIRMGDWIQVPGADADGSVVDITLTSVRVENWDNTVTTVPAYNLLASPFKNWRNMFEKGGRRIKRSIWIDVDSIGFASDEMLSRWKEMNLIRAYLADKLKEIHAYNQKQASCVTSIANTRQLTNIGTFRAYCLAYLKAHAEVNQEMLVLVRQLQPTDRGLPLEIYCFTKDTSWTTYERVQGDIFDHLLAILPEFGLRYFQVVSAASVRGTRLSSSTI
jgi:miniconductance mechanosensitive channel